MKPLTLAASIGILLAACFVSLLVGAIEISAFDVFREFFLNEADALSANQENILLAIRLPRIVAAALVGASLGVAGVAFQGLFRNPLAEPYIIGASSGAALGVTLVIVLGWNIAWLGLQPASLGGLAGSVALIALVLFIGAFARRATSLTLLLAGVAISSMVNSLVSLLMFLNDEKVFVIIAWLMGSLAGSNWSSVVTTLVLSVVGAGILFALSRPLDAYLLGDTASQSLGVNLVLFRILLVLGAGIVTASAVASGGVIGFVGLVAPHIARWQIGPSHRWLLPMSACTGAYMLVVADTFARTIVAPTELPVGVVTALMGCPLFLALLISQSRARGFNGVAA